MGKLQQFDGQAIEVLDSPPPSPQLAPATPERKAPPCYDSMDSQEKVMPKRPMSFRRISNLVRKMNCGDALEKTWPKGLEAFQVGGRYFCKAKRAFDSDEEILDTSLVNGPYDLESEEEGPSKAPEEVPEEPLHEAPEEPFQYPDPAETFQVDPEHSAQVAPEVEELKETQIPLQD